MLETLASLSTCVKGVQFYCPSRTSPAIPYCTIFPFLAHCGMCDPQKGFIPSATPLLHNKTTLFKLVLGIDYSVISKMASKFRVHIFMPII